MHADKPGLYLVDAVFDHVVNIVLCLGHGSLLNPATMDTLHGWLFASVGTVAGDRQVPASVLPVVDWRGVVYAPAATVNSGLMVVNNLVAVKARETPLPLPVTSQLRPITAVTALNCRAVRIHGGHWWCALTADEGTLLPFVPSAHDN